jgi:hypothetical protein
MKYLFILSSLFFTFNSFAQGLKMESFSLMEFLDSEKPEKRKNGVYISLFAGLNSHLGNATLIETKEGTVLVEEEQEFVLSSFPGLKFGLNFEVDFGISSSLYLEVQGEVDNGTYIDNGDEIVVSTATTQAKLMFGHDIGIERNFTFRAGAGLMAYAIPIFNGNVNQEINESDIKLIPSGYFGVEWNATQWFILGVEHRRLFNFPNEVYVRYNTYGELESYTYQVSNFSAYFKLRLMLFRYKH